MELSEVGLVGLSIIIPLSMSSVLASRTSYADLPLSRCLVDLEALYAKAIAMQFYQWRQNERRYLCDPRVGTCRARDTTSPVMFFRCMPFLSRHCIAPSSVSSPRLYMHDSLRDSDRGCFSYRLSAHSMQSSRRSRYQRMLTITRSRRLYCTCRTVVKESMLSE